MALSPLKGPNIEVLFDGLVHKTTVFYRCEEGRRIYIPRNRLRYQTTPYLQREVTLFLPLFITYEVWKRYKYSMEDVKRTLEWNSTEHLYQLGLLYQIPPSPSAVKLAFSSTTSLVFSSKAIITRKILSQLQEHYTFPTESCLDKIREEHVPALPIVHVDRKTFEHWKSQIHPTLNIMEGAHWNRAWKFKDILMVPFWMEKGAILMNRIIEKSVFNESGRGSRMCKSLATKPIPVTLGTTRKEYCGVEEACFLVPK